MLVDNKQQAEQLHHLVVLRFTPLLVTVLLQQIQILVIHLIKA
jgi:hypothetical protein